MTKATLTEKRSRRLCVNDHRLPKIRLPNEDIPVSRRAVFMFMYYYSLKRNYLYTKLLQNPKKCDTIYTDILNNEQKGAYLTYDR